MMLNMQPKEGLDLHPGELDIVGIFPTIQGEGPFVGTPAVFIRLAGCNLSDVCKGCDTDYTSNRKRMTVEQITKEVTIFRDCGLVVITGGEPFRQGLKSITDQLIGMGNTVQIETNGTLYQELDFDKVKIVCSPKTPNLHPHLWPHITALKYILEYGKVSTIDGLPTSSLGSGLGVVRPKREFFKGDVFVQPMDEQDENRNRSNLMAAVDSCMRFGYRLCLQIHKIVGLD